MQRTILLTSLALGLGIAVLCMFFHLFLHGMSKKIKADMERSVMKLENLLSENVPQHAPGAR